MIYCTLVAFAIALGLGFAAVPLAKRFALFAGLVDHPDKTRKLHSNAIPLIGGITVFITVLISLGIVALVFREQLSQLTINYRMLGGLLLACFVILMLGVVDDRFVIRGRQKLLGQIIAATILIWFGYRFDSISLYGKTLDLEIFSIIVIYAWILIGINSVNLLDGADGFATSLGLLMSIALCIMAFSLQKYDDAIICAAMAGALLAFLKFNFPPASAYLGDAGSMLIGLFIAGMSIKCTSKEAAAYAFLAPIALLAIPMFDTLAAIVRRRLTGRSIYATDRGHLHHQLMGKGFGPRKALMLFFAMCLMTATGGTLALIYKQAEYAALSIFAVIVFLFVGRVFGFAEFKLISTRSRSMLRSFFTRPTVPGGRGHHASVRLQGQRNWELCWQVLREFAENKNLLRMTMDLNLPWIHESFHANFNSTERKKNVTSNEQWSVELPLVVENRVIGRINIVASVQDTDFAEIVSELNVILESLQSYFVETIDGKLVKESSTRTVEFPDQPKSHDDDSRALDVG